MLTPAQSEVAQRLLDAYAAFYAEHRLPPTRREWAKATDYSPSGLDRYLLRMQAAGLIAIDARTARGIRVLTRDVTG